MYRVRILVFALVWALALPAFAGSGTALFDRGRARYFSAKAIKAPTQKRNAYLRAVGELKQFIGLYPKHYSVPAALFNIASIYKELAEDFGDRDDAGRGLHYYREILRLTPKDPLADDALHGVAQICAKIFKDDQCQNEAEARIRSEYPYGDMAAKLAPEPVKEDESEDAPAPQTMVSATSGRVEVLSTEIEQRSDGVILRVKLNRSTSFISKYLQAENDKKIPARFFLDLQNAHLDRTAKAPTLSSAPAAAISAVRMGQNTLETVRVVLDLGSAVSLENITTGMDGPEIMIRVGIPGAQFAEVKSTPTSTPTSSPTASVASISPVKKSFRIVVDAGHGGDDTGARGPKGTYEKEITLEIAKKVERLLIGRGMYDVFMTRREDKTLALSDRTNFANHVGGDLFVSVHCNASPKHSAEGVSTYFLDNADDEESLRVAMRENGELTAPAVPDRATSEEYYLEVMKASMEKNFHTVQSTDLARNVQSSLVEKLRSSHKDVEDLGVRSARFYVLTGAKMPAVLVETSFISNPKEEKRLRDDRYQDKLAQAILRGIDKFFKNTDREQSHAKLYRN